MTRSARAQVRLAVVAIVAVSLASMLMVLYPLLPPRQTRDVAPPPDDATPELVVRTYLDALTAHDCATATSLWTADTRDIAASWCVGVASLDDMVLGATVTEPAGASTSRPGEEVSQVPVSFVLHWRRWHGDASLPGGPTTWGYLLVREPGTSAWRIVDNGVG